ncbi:hypothetical protein BY996DRAFT_6429779 [Phakopsora pachyrhizi]|nr:hypothetical protein BY996DRAFT_6429779 [Phakopsora pachyrhizi]
MLSLRYRLYLLPARKRRALPLQREIFPRLPRTLKRLSVTKVSVTFVHSLKKKRFLKVSCWTWIVIAGQLVVLSVAIAFFIMIQGTRTPMTQQAAEWARDSPRGMAFVVTGISTALSALATFFFSKSLILFLTAHSNRPTPLFNFLTMTHLSRGTPIFSTNHLFWTTVSLLALVLLNSLTACFTTLITPTPLIINVPIRGKEFNLNSDIFLKATGNRTFASTFPLMTPADMAANNKVAAVVKPLPLSSAYATASRHLGYPGVFSYLGSTLSSSTGGILPAIPIELKALESTPSVSSFANFSSIKPRFAIGDSGFKPSRVFPFNYTTVQQGYTSDIECKLLSENQSSSLPGLTSHLVSNITFPDNTTSSFYQFFYQCPNRPLRNLTRLLRPRGSMIASGTCPNQDFDGNEVPGSQLLIMAGYGPMYSFIAPRVCQFTPYFTWSEVVYTRTVNVTRVLSRTPVTRASQRLAQYIFDGVIDAMDEYVVDKRDKIGDDLSSLYGIVSDVNVQNNDLLNGILSNYFIGMVETRATLIKTPPVVIGGRHVVATDLEKLSNEWVDSFNGTWSYETLGWHKANDGVRGSILGLLPVMIITLTSIFLSLHSWLVLKRSQQHKEEPFDPNNLVTLLRAGRDGSVVNTLGLEEPNGVGSPLHRNNALWELRPVVKQS